MTGAAERGYMEMSAAAVILDFDGVIIDSSATVIRRWRSFADRFGLDKEHLLATVHGRRSADVIRQWVGDEQQAEARDWLSAIELTEDPPLPPIAGALHLLASLPDGRWAIASSANRATICRCLQDAGLPAPTVVVSAEDVTHGKPDPECYLLAAQRLAMDITRCVVIEDAPAGIDAASRAGAAVIGIATTHSSTQLNHATVVAADLQTIRVELRDDDPSLRIVVGEIS
jgi:sugar-phosphatase